MSGGGIIFGLLILAGAPPSAESTQTDSDTAILKEVESSTEDTIRKVMDAEMKTLITPGPHEPDWATAGVDQEAALAALPGGIEGNAFLTEGDDRVLRYLGRREQVLPDRLTTEVPIPAALGTGPTETNAQRVKSGLWFEMRDGVRKAGTARCYSGFGELRMRSAPGFKLAAQERETLIEALKLTRGQNSRELCISFRRDKDGAYRHRYFLPDGRSLPNMDDPDERSRIVPLAAAIDAVMTGRPQFDLAPKP